MRGRTVRRAAGAVVVVGLTLVAAVQTSLPGVADATERSVAADAVRAATSDSADDLAASPPAGFAAVMGYEPALVEVAGEHRLVDESGDCSTPTGDTSFDFGVACQAHDYGYDLLRYAERTGQPLGQWARAAIDAQFSADIQQRCDTYDGAAEFSCDRTADAYAAAVRFNSWRQSYGVPGGESAGSWFASLFIAIGRSTSP